MHYLFNPNNVFVMQAKKKGLLQVDFILMGRFCATEFLTFTRIALLTDRDCFCCCCWHIGVKIATTETYTCNNLGTVWLKSKAKMLST